MAQNSKNRFLSVQQYAEEMGISRSTVYRHIDQGKLETEEIEGVLHVVLDLSQNETDVPQYAKEMIQHLKEENQKLQQKVERLENELLQSGERHDNIVQKMQEDTESQKERSDTIILKLTQHLEQSQKALTAQRESFWQRLSSKVSFWSDRSVQQEAVQ